MMVAVIYSPGQLPLIEFVESDDLFLQDEPDALWFDVLGKLDHRKFQTIAARFEKFTSDTLLSEVQRWIVEGGSILESGLAELQRSNAPPSGQPVILRAT